MNLFNFSAPRQACINGEWDGQPRVPSPQNYVEIDVHDRKNDYGPLLD